MPELTLVLDFGNYREEAQSSWGEWIEDAKRFSLKNYLDITAPEMLWRFGLGPRPRDMDPAILTLDQLNRVRPFVVLAKETTPTTTTQTSKGESTLPPTAEEVAEEEDEGLQRRRPRQPVGGAPLNVVPLSQVPYLQPPSKFSFEGYLRPLLWALPLFS